MKRMLLLVIALVFVCLMLGIYVISDADASKWVEDAWDQEDNSGSSSGEWGTEIVIEYEDGTNETLKTLKITHDGKNVSKFIYKLSAKGDSDGLATCSLDLTGFCVEGIATSDGATEWTAPVEYGTAGDLDLDNVWHEVYRLEVEADDLQSNLADGDYKLEFTPSGSIYYRGDANNKWVELKDIPSTCWLTFDKEEYWIEITLEGGVED